LLPKVLRKKGSGCRKMRTISKWIVAIAVVAAISGYHSAQAAMVGMPRALGTMVKRISFSDYTLPPMAYTQFCIRYSDQCRETKVRFRGGPVHLTTGRLEDLNEVNNSVNNSIIPEANTEGLAAEKWLINPLHGDCNDYAVTKRAQLLDRGWPARVLLLSEVVTSWGEHHLVLVVRTSSGDMILDNLTPQIRQWSRAPYRWVRMQTPKNPNFWATLDTRNA
jgi:predicted transglutaminase-like cysteine proteinase